MARTDPPTWAVDDFMPLARKLVQKGLGRDLPGWRGEEGRDEAIEEEAERLAERLREVTADHFYDRRGDLRTGVQE